MYDKIKLINKTKDDLLMTITVYSKDRCPACRMTKKFLDNANLHFTEINIDHVSSDERDDIITYLKNTLKRTSLPVIITDEVVISGFDIHDY